MRILLLRNGYHPLPKAANRKVLARRRFLHRASESLFPLLHLDYCRQFAGPCDRFFAEIGQCGFDPANVRLDSAGPAEKVSQSHNKLR
ncbi:MAG: hypothetical protein QM739_07190 [Propionivibrio sp.]